MIYLIKSIGYKEEEEGKISTFFLLKIGYTEDQRQDIRFIEYRLHNPTCQVLYTIPEATEEQEKKLHYRFKDLLYEDYGREWFKYSEDIINYIKSVTLEEIDKLPGNPARRDQKILLGKREAKKIISYLFNTKEEIKEYLENLSEILGDTISGQTSLDYIKSDSKIDKNKLNKYFEIIKARETGIYCEDQEVNQEVSKFMRVYDSHTTMYDKLRCLCEYGLSKEAIEIILSQISDSDEIKSYYTTLGPQRLHALGYSVTRIKKALGIVVFSQDLLRSEIYSNFRENEKYTLVNLKNKLTSIYSSINYYATPKATDIENWFEVREISIYEKKEDGGRKRIRGYELLKSKRDILDEKYSN